MALEVSVNELEQAAIGGPSSEGMRKLIAKMSRADRTFPTSVDEDVLTTALRMAVKREEMAIFKELEIAISAKRMAKMTAKMLRAAAQRALAERQVAA